MKNEGVDNTNYTKEYLLTLLDQFGVYQDENGVIIFPKETTQRDVGNLIYTDNTTISNWISKEQYKTFIQRLEHYNKLKETEKDLEKTTRANARYIVIICSLVLGIISLFFFFVNKPISMDQDSMVKQPMKIDTGMLNEFVISDRETFDAIKNYHVEFVTYRLIFEIINTNATLNNPDSLMSEVVALDLLEEDLRNAIRTSRGLLSNIGFTNEKGFNLVSFVDDLYNSDELFTSKDTLFSKQFNNMLSVIKNPKATPSTLLKNLETASSIIRNKQWDKVWEVGDFE